MATTDPDTFLNHLFGPEGGGSAQRPWLVLDWCAALGDGDGPAFWQVILRAWSTFDLIPHGDFAAQFARFASTAPPKPDMPERMTVYRGQDDSAPLGLSWTLSWDVAEGFARGAPQHLQPGPGGAGLGRVALRGRIPYQRPRGAGGGLACRSPARGGGRCRLTTH